MDSLKFIPDRLRWWVGEEITGRLVLGLSRRANIEAAELQFSVFEFVRAVEDSSDGPTSLEATEVLFGRTLAITAEGGAPFPNGEFDKGTHAWRFSVKTSDHLPETFEKGKRGGSMIAVRCELSAHLSIPWWFDPKAKTSLSLVAPPRIPGPGAFQGKIEPGSFQRPESMELALAAAEVPRTGHLAGTLAVTADGLPRLRQLRIRLREEGTGLVGGNFAYTNSILAEAATATPPAPGQPVPWTLALPAGLAPSYEGKICHVRHFVEAEADVSLGKDARVAVAVKIT